MLARAARRVRGGADVRAGVHPQRATWPARSSALACGLVGWFLVLRGRCSPATRSATSRSSARSRPPRSASTSASACSRDALVGIGDRRPRRPRAGRRVDDRDRLRLDPRARRAAAGDPRDQRRRRQRDHHRQHPVRLDLLAQRRARRARRGDRLGGDASCCSRSPGRCCCARSTPRSRRCEGAGAAAGQRVPGRARIVTAESTQAVGALLLLGLIAAPAGAARELTARPVRGRSRCRARSQSARCGAGWRSATRSPRCRRAARSSGSAAARLAGAGMAGRGARRSSRARRGANRSPGALAARAVGDGARRDRGPAGVPGRESWPGPPPVPRIAGRFLSRRDEAHVRRIGRRLEATVSETRRGDASSRLRSPPCFGRQLDMCRNVHSGSSAFRRPP